MTKIFKVFLLSAFLFTALPANASASASQTPIIEWKSGFGPDFSQGMVRQTRDGGFIAAGSIKDFATGLLKTDPTGKTQWEKPFFSAQSPFYQVSSLLQTADEGYAFLYKYTDSVASNVYLVKADSNGNKEWAKPFNYLLDNNTLLQSEDGGFVIVGSAIPGKTSCIYIIKTNSLGEKEWAKFYEDSSPVLPQSARITTDGGLIILGNKNIAGAQSDIYLAKLNLSGEMKWQKTLAGKYSGTGNDIIESNDGGFIITGSKTREAKDKDVYLIKTDSEGNPQWFKTYGKKTDETGIKIMQTKDGGYLVAGTRNTGGLADNILLAKFNAKGNQQWEKGIGGIPAASSYASYLNQTDDGGYIIAGHTRNGLASNYLLVKLSTKKTSPNQADAIEINIKGRPLYMDTPPVIVNNRTLVPFRSIGEATGSTVYWDESTKTVTLTREAKQIILIIGDDYAQVNNRKVKLDVPATIINNRAMVPLRFIAEALDFNVSWSDYPAKAIQLWSK